MTPMNDTKTCPVCEKGRLVPTLQTFDYFLTREPFELWTCNHCTYTTTHPFPPLSQLGKYYQSEEYLSHSADQKGLINKIYKKLRNINLKQKYQHITKYAREGQLLDIGCGTGEFLHFMQKNNWQVEGIEPNEQARKFAIEKYNLKVNDENQLKKLADHSFDVITMWHVLEHVPDLNERITEVKRLLAPKGTIVIAVPNLHSPDAKKYGKFWAGLDVPRHLHHFSPTSFEALAKLHHLNLVDMIPMKMDAYYVSMLSEKYMKHSFVYFRAIMSGLLSNFNASKKNNYSSMIFVLKPS